MSNGRPFVCKEYLACYPELLGYARIKQAEERYLGSLSIQEHGLVIYPEDSWYEEKRWGPSRDLNPEHLEQFLSSSPELGSIYGRSDYPYPHNEVHQTMRDTCMANLIYEFGKTYVGIGYVDLFQIAWGHYKESISGIRFYSENTLKRIPSVQKLLYDL